MENIEINSINNLSEKTYSDIEGNGISVIKEMFAKGKTFSEQLKVDPEKEYLKRMIISQMKISDMLMVHKYYGMGLESKKEHNDECEQLEEKSNKTDSTLCFNNDVIESLFGNSLEIATIDEYDALKEITKDENHDHKMFYEESFKHEYENERNPIKKFIQSFKYKKMFKQNTLEDPYTKKAREVVRNAVISNNGKNASYVIDEIDISLNKGIDEYKNLQELEVIAKTTLESLQQPVGEMINIENTCNKIRNVMQEDKFSEFETEYRQKQVTLGNAGGIGEGNVAQTIPFESIPNAIQELQQRYEDVYTTAQTEQEYIKEVTKIYVDFITIQPYSDGNKRTASCLLNSMLLSKGIVPPPVSLVNDQKMIAAFNKSRDKDYIDLEDIMVDKCEQVNPAIIGEDDSELSKIDLSNHQEIEAEER